MVADGMFRPLLDGEKVTNNAADWGDSGQKLVPIIPVPDNARRFDWCHPLHGRPVATWRYCDAEGRPVAHVARVEYLEGGERKVVSERFSKSR